MKILHPPVTLRDISKLRAGDLVKISGRIFTARDKAYVRVVQSGKAPVDMRGGVVYHCGPLVVRHEEKYEVISAGPTTSSRMDEIQERFLRITGVKVLIGKGGVGEKIAARLPELGCVYLSFPGGAGVLAAGFVEEVEGVIWEDLGPAEAIWVLRVKDFPCVVAIDIHGKNLYTGRMKRK
ncbi:MAG: FumA C-terminus/TtdB family hydratase beta subunit [Candidatus Hadarchaeales archaeon]